MQLSIAKKVAFDLLKAENLLQAGWRCQFDDARKRLGLCHYRKKIISLSRYFIALNPDEVTLDTIRHEVAHALTPDCGHNKQWQEVAVRLGANPKARCGDAVAPEGKYTATCPNCAVVTSREIEPPDKSKFACGACCKKYNAGKVSAKYLYVWRNTRTGEVFLDGAWAQEKIIPVIDPSIATDFISRFGATKVIEMKQIGVLPNFKFTDYDFRSTPQGVFRAFLEVKMFRDVNGKRVLKTYWRNVEGAGIVIDVWENSFTGEYETADRRVSLRKINVGCWYELIVMPTPNGFLRLQTAKFSG